MGNLVMWEPFLVTSASGMLAAVLTWRPGNLSKSSEHVSRVPALFLAIGTAPSVFSEGHGVAFVPAIFLLPILFASPLSAFFLSLMPMGGTFFFFSFLLTRFSKRWRRDRGLA